MSTVLVITQVYVPDPASVGQHLHDVSLELVKQGKRVVVFTPTGGYDEPDRRYTRREILDGVEIIRFPFCAFGKNPLFLRLFSGISLVLQCMVFGLFIKGLTHIFISTAPPMSSLGALFIRLFRQARIVYWVMDLNPDQLVAIEKLSEHSLIVRFSDAVNRLILRYAYRVIALDEFMAKRLAKKSILGHRLLVIPPWPYENQLAAINHSDNPFRKKHNFGDKFVVMYSGNISFVHPIDTLLDVAKRVKEDDRLIFVFIGSEKERRNIDRYALRNRLLNVKTLPYVPLNETQFSLSAADLHVVTMGDAMVGCVHPCKVYGVMSVGRPFLMFGPQNCHVGEIVKRYGVGWAIEHGKVDEAAQLLRKISSLPNKELMRLGDRARNVVEEKYLRKVLCLKFCEAFET